MHHTHNRSSHCAHTCALSTNKKKVVINYQFDCFYGIRFFMMAVSSAFLCSKIVGACALLIHFAQFSLSLLLAFIFSQQPFSDPCDELISFRVNAICAP